MPTVRLLPSVEVDLDLALADDRVLVLGDLIALRQVGVEVVLAVEHRAQVDLAPSGPSPVRTACSTQRALITGSMPGMAASTSDTWVLGSAPNVGRRAGEQLGVGDHLGMDFQPQDDFPVAGFAFDQ